MPLSINSLLMKKILWFLIISFPILPKSYAQRQYELQIGETYLTDNLGTVLYMNSNGTGSITSVPRKSSCKLLKKVKDYYFIQFGNHEGYIPSAAFGKYPNLVKTSPLSNNESHEINENKTLKAGQTCLTDLGTVLYNNSDGSGSITTVPGNSKIQILVPLTNFHYVQYKNYKGYISDKSICRSPIQSGQSDNVNQDNFLLNLPPILSIQDISFSNNFLRAGETAKLSITLKNIGAGDANNVYVNLSSDLTGLKFNSRTNFPVIEKSGGIQKISIDINGSLDLPTTEAILKIEVIEPNFRVRITGKQVKFPTKEFLKPELLLAKFAVIENLSANPNNQIDINEQIDLKFAVQNIGQGIAENVNVSVSNNQIGVMLLGVVDNFGNLIRKNPSFDLINIGKFETITYRYFVNSEFTSNQLVFTINTTEKQNKFGFAQTKSVEINKILQEEGYIRTIAIANNDNLIKGNVIIEDIPDFVSDVDQNIPVNSISNGKTFAVIIGNEVYSKEIKVKYALNDARIFRQYLQKTFGLPNNNIHYIENATFGQILDALKWINAVIKAYNGEAKVIFYYAGHGLPDEQTKSAFILPVDGSSQNTETAVKLADIYSKLAEYQSNSVTILLDACFSGATRELSETMLAQGRGVRIKPKNDLLTGNLVVLSATTGDETAFPYIEKQHGLFTYYLLKKLQESKGGATLNELSSYIITNVTQKSVVVNKKSQTPQVNTSQQFQNTWKTLMLK